MPCSMNWSGQPMRTTGVSIPCSARLSSTAEPKPPARTWSSKVTSSEQRFGVALDALVIEGLGEAGVDDGRALAFLAQHCGEAFGLGQHAAEREDRDVVDAVAAGLRLCRSRERRGHVFHRSAGADAARIADGDGAVVLQRGEHHVGQFVLVLGDHVDDVGDAAQIADVEEAVVRGAVVAGEAAAIHAEDHGQVLQADVVHDLVEGALQEGGIDGAEAA